MQNDQSFFRFQERAGCALLAWGAGSMLVGMPLLLGRNRAVRQVGIQAFVWGAIDAAIGLLGRRSARQSLARGATDVAEQARRFRLLVLLNTLLDIGYVAGGAWLLHSADGRPERAGAGVGVAVQGAFLLVFDAALTWRAGRWVPSADTKSA